MNISIRLVLSLEYYYIIIIIVYYYVIFKTL